MQELLMKDGTSALFAEKVQELTEGIIIELKNLDASKIPNSKINSTINYTIESMKVDNMYLMLHKNEALKTRMRLNDSIASIPTLSKEEISYLQKIPERMKKNQELFQNAAEEKMYQKILDNSTKISPEKDSLTTGNAVALWLEMVVTWKNENYFLNTVNSGSKTGFNWNV